MVDCWTDCWCYYDDSLAIKWMILLMSWLAGGGGFGGESGIKN